MPFALAILYLLFGFITFIFIPLSCRAWRTTQRLDSKAKRPQDNSLYILLLLGILSSCGSSKPVADFSSVQVEKEQPVKVDTTRAVHTDTYSIPVGGDTAVVKVTPPKRTKAGKIISSITGRDKAKITTGGIILPRKNKGSISVVVGSGTATAAVTGKKSDAPVGDGATLTKIGKAKAPIAVGKGIHQEVQEVKKPNNTWLWIIGGLAGAYGIWYLIAAGAGVVGLLAVKNWRWILGAFVVLGGVLIYLFR